MAQPFQARLTTKSMKVFPLEDVQSQRHCIILAIFLQGNDSSTSEWEERPDGPVSRETTVALAARTLPGVSFGT